MGRIIDSYDPSRHFADFFRQIFEEIRNTLLDNIDSDNIIKKNYIDRLLNNTNNRLYIEELAISTLIRDFLPQKLKELKLPSMPLSGLPKRELTALEGKKSVRLLSDIDDNNYGYDYEADVYNSLLDIIDATYILFIAKLTDTMRERGEIEEPDSEFISFLDQKDMPESFSREDIDHLKTLILDKLKEKKFQTQFIKDELGIYIIQYYAYGAKEMELVKEMSKELGILDNDHLISLIHSISQEKINMYPQIREAFQDILDKNESFDRLEQGTISNTEKKLLRPEDYVVRFIQNVMNGKSNNPELLERIKPTLPIEMFKQGFLSFDDIYILLTNPESKFSKCSSRDLQKIKQAIRYTFLFKTKEEAEEYKNNYQNFTGLECLKLTSLGFIDHIDMMRIYLKLKEENNPKQEQSKELYHEKTEFEIFQDDVKEFYTAQKALELYLQGVIDKTLFKGLIHEFIELEDMRQEVLNSQSVSNEEFIYFHSIGILMNDDIFQKIHKSEGNDKYDENFKQEFFNHISQINDVKSIISYFNTGILSEDDLIEIFDDEYENIIREAFRKRYIVIDRLKYISFIDSDIIMEEYQKSLEMHLEHPEKKDEELDFESMLDFYLLTDHTVTFDNISQIVREKKDPIFQDENFNLSEYICTMISEDSKAIENIKTLDKKIIISRIKELYMNSFISYEGLNKLVENEVITPAKAKEINDEFCQSQQISKLKHLKLGDSDSLISSQNNTHTNVRNPQKTRNIQTQPSEKQILQAETMVEYMSKLGFSAITTTNAFGLTKMETFSSGDFMNYRVFLSDENPDVVVLIHLKQIPNSDTYYHVGNNATYIMSTSSFVEYLHNNGQLESALTSFDATKSRVKDSKYTRRANVGKTWGMTLARKISEIQHQFDKTELQEFKTKDFEIASILPADVTKDRLEALRKCLNELDEIKTIDDD